MQLFMSSFLSSWAQVIHNRLDLFTVLLMAVAVLQAADQVLKESKKACESFNITPPLSR